MATHTNEWEPDTCDCIVEFTFDDSLDSAPHTFSRFINICSAHQQLGNDIARWNVLHEENPRKNLGLQHILDNGPAALFDLVNGQRMLKGGIILNFSFSGTAPDRVLTISFTGITLTQNQKNTIQSALNTRFGTGKVLIA